MMSNLLNHQGAEIAPSNLRAQALANCKFLYGANTEILTLYCDDGHQALAFEQDSITKSATKVLLTKPNASSTNEAILWLLQESESAISRLLSGDPIQTMTLQRGAQSCYSVSSTPMSEDSEFLSTSGSSLQEITVIENCKQGQNHPFEPGADYYEGPARDQSEIEECSNPELKVTVDDDFGLGLSSEKGKQKKSRIVIDEPALELEPESEVVVDDDLGWGGSWKKGKKNKGRTITEVPAFESEPEPEVAVDDDLGWGGSWKKGKKNKGRSITGESALEPELEPELESEVVVDDNFGFGFLPKKMKLKKSRRVIEEPVLEPEPESEVVVDEDLGWGGSWKKSKQKNGRRVIEEPVIEVIEPKPEVPVDNGVTRGFSAIEPEPEMVLEIEPKPKVAIGNNVSWFFSTTEPQPEVVLEIEPESKVAIGNNVSWIFSATEPQPEVVLADDFTMDFSFKKCKKNLGNPTVSGSPEEKGLPVVVVEHTVEPHPIVEVCRSPHPESQSELEEVDADIQFELETPKDNSTDIISHHFQRQNQDCGHTVILKILHSGQNDDLPLQVMTTLTENTRKAIFDAVNSNLNSRTQLAKTQGERKLEIICGTGKSGDIHLSGLMESKWQEYLDYFSQCTQFPELTVDVLDK